MEPPDLPPEEEEEIPIAPPPAKIPKPNYPSNPIKSSQNPMVTPPNVTEQRQKPSRKKPTKRTRTDSSKRVRFKL